jgi:hypothetical protein
MFWAFAGASHCCQIKCGSPDASDYLAWRRNPGSKREKEKVRAQKAFSKKSGKLTEAPHSCGALPLVDLAREKTGGGGNEAEKHYGKTRKEVAGDNGFKSPPAAKRRSVELGMA